MLVFPWFVWRALPSLIFIFSHLLLICAKVLAYVLLFLEYLLTQYIRQQGRQPPNFIYIYGEFLSGMVSTSVEVTQQSKKIFDYAIKKRWLLRRGWFVTATIILAFTWYFRPIFRESSIAKFIDGGVMWWYSIEGWGLYSKRSSSALSSPAPTKFIQAYYLAINERQYPTAWNCLSYEFQSNRLSWSSGFISYVNSLEIIEQVNIKKISLEKQTSNSAIVKIRLQYLMRNTQTQSELKSVRLWLVRDAKTRKWMINYFRFV